MKNHKQGKKIVEKKSVGIAPCRMNERGEIEILLVCRRCTYAFDLFMQGNYNSHNDSDILALLDKMTTDEKIILVSLDFQIIWYYWWMNSEISLQYYFRLRDKYLGITNDGASRLTRLIAKSSTGSKVWEIPKGKRNHNELNIHGAIRELNEETGLKKQDYRILLAAPKTLSFNDSGVKYSTTYYIADTINKVNTRVQLSYGTIGEISEVRWMTISEIKFVDQYARLIPLCKSIIQTYKKHKKNIS